MKRGIDFLTEVVKSKRQRLKQDQANRSLGSFRDAAYARRSKASRHTFRTAVEADGVNVIAEVKKASPSKGDLHMRGSVEEIAKSYVLGGAAALSVLTEEDYFRGRLDDLRTVRDVVSIPVLRKDFIFEDYQVYESAEAGADALLLIVALLDDQLLKQLLAMTEDELGMDALVEVHTREELRRARQAGAHLIGVNNRDLRSFDVSLDVSLDLAEQAQSQATLISESGLRTATDLKRLRLAGYRGFLIGEALVGSQDPAQALRELITLAEN